LLALLYPNKVRTREADVHVITSRDGLLQTLPELGALAGSGRTLGTGISALDALAPGGAFACGAVHEVLNPSTKYRSFLLPALLARSAVAQGWIAWCDCTGELYPTALHALGVPMNRLLVLRPSTPVEALWTMAECLRCRGIAACICPVGKISRIQARRLQLAAEHGGGIGIVLRGADALGWPYAAATRWMVSPARGERMVQRVRVELLHGHGGRIGQSVLLEVCRETNHVRAADKLADRSDKAFKTG
jgi:protein ImuA